MVRRYWAILASILLIGAGTGCNRGTCTEETARQSVIDYLSKQVNLNVANMNVTVTSLTCREKDADATVAFSAKGANPGEPMTRRYTLERQGTQWVVKHSADNGRNPHGAGAGASGLPAGHPAVGGSTEPGTALPPGHPSVDSGAPKK